MFQRPLQPRALADTAEIMRAEPDDSTFRRPLWEWLPEEVPLVLHERRRRFGIADERVDPADLEEDDAA